jgi:hypothetical protein
MNKNMWLEKSVYTSYTPDPAQHTEEQKKVYTLRFFYGLFSVVVEFHGLLMLQ